MGIPHTVAENVTRLTALNGGGTFNPDGTVYEDGGYALSINPEWSRVMELEDLTPTQVTMYFHDFSHPDKKIGTWVHEGKVHFDVVTIIKDLDLAMFLARAHKQIAIFDIDALEEHNVDAYWKQWSEQEEG